MDMAEILYVFRLIAPEFSRITDDVVARWITITGPLVSQRKLRGLWPQALANLTAHKMKMAAVGSNPEDDPLADIGNVGVGGLTRVTNFSEGQTSIGFNANITQFADLNAEFSLTQYGIQYLSLLRMSIMSITSAGEAHGRV